MRCGRIQILSAGLISFDLAGPVTAHLREKLKTAYFICWWTALKDKIINIPVNEDDIVNTITSLPRTPNEAGLIEVDLKRKVE